MGKCKMGEAGEWESEITFFLINDIKPIKLKIESKSLHPLEI